MWPMRKNMNDVLTRSTNVEHMRVTKVFSLVEILFTYFFTVSANLLEK